MKQYKGLADIYDYLVSGVDFEFWLDYVESLLQRFNLKAHSVVDLACGTGNTIIPLAHRGYDAIGVDLAAQMLAKARQKAAEQKLSIKFMEQDMRYFSLPKPVDLAISFHDGLNYLLDIEDIKKTFQKVHENLCGRGAFIFDLNALTWIAGADHSTTMVEEPDMTLIYDTNYNHTQKTWQITLVGFIKQNGYYQKFTETHQEKAYHPTEIKAVLHDVGFHVLGVFDAFTFDPITPKSIRHFYVAQKV